jgi:hypothetical protein
MKSAMILWYESNANNARKTNQRTKRCFCFVGKESENKISLRQGKARKDRGRRRDGVSKKERERNKQTEREIERGIFHQLTSRNKCQQLKMSPCHPRCISFIAYPRYCVQMRCSSERGGRLNFQMKVRDICTKTNSWKREDKSKFNSDILWPGTHFEKECPPCGPHK